MFEVFDPVLVTVEAHRVVAAAFLDPKVAVGPLKQGGGICAEPRGEGQIVQRSVRSFASRILAS